MDVQKCIEAYIESQPQKKREDMMMLHEKILQLMPDEKLWFLSGKDNTGKTVSNPSIGYGKLMKTYADGTSREFYRIGLSANTTGISVYILGIEDKAYLQKTYRKTIGKATVSGYCIKFKTLKNIDLDILQTAIRSGVKSMD